MVSGKTTTLIPSTKFKVKAYDNQTIKAINPTEVTDFQENIAKLGKALHGTQQFIAALDTRINNIKQAIDKTPNSPPSLSENALAIEKEIQNLNWKLQGERPKASPEEVTPAIPPINQRYSALRWIHNNSSARITQTEKDLLKILKEEFPPVLKALKKIRLEKIPKLEANIEAAGGPWTSGRIPGYKN